MNYLLDTNILREFVRLRPDRNVARRLSQTPKENLFTSALCIAELRVWSRRGDDPGQRWEKVLSRITPNLTAALPFNEGVAISAGDLLFDLQSAGWSLPPIDGLIAATALKHGMILVTRNLRDFDRIPGLVLENWFE